MDDNLAKLLAQWRLRMRSSAERAPFTSIASKDNGTNQHTRLIYVGDFDLGLLLWAFLSARIDRSQYEDEDRAMWLVARDALAHVRFDLQRGLIHPPEFTPPPGVDLTYATFGALRLTQTHVLTDITEDQIDLYWVWLAPDGHVEAYPLGSRRLPTKPKLEDPAPVDEETQKRLDQEKEARTLERVERCRAAYKASKKKRGEEPEAEARKAVAAKGVGLNAFLLGAVMGSAAAVLSVFAWA